MRELHRKIEKLKNKLKGEVLTDSIHRFIYASDASVYQEVPVGVSYPRDKNDIQTLMLFAKENKLPLIPRAAGTSLAGQVVGNGLVVDVSRYLTAIISMDIPNKTAWVEPGVIRDELNRRLKPHGLFFSPETSTSNRCMIGGMVGNNACGMHSLVYGSTRDHLLAVKGFLSDGSEVEFKPLSDEQLQDKLALNNLEGDIYRHIHDLLSKDINRTEIFKEYPHPDINRRNTGYALDIIARQQPFNPEGRIFNLAPLIAGSEGTLMFMTEIMLSLSPLPPPEKCLVCAHYHSVSDAIEGNLIALKHHPQAVELMDHMVVTESRSSPGYHDKGFFIKGEPGAVLMIELAGENTAEMDQRTQQLLDDFKQNNSGYHFPVLRNTEIEDAWELRRVGLGMLSKIPGDYKPTPVVEDTALKPEDLPGFIFDFNQMLKRHKLSCAYYAHIGTGELHLRPLLNLKTNEGKQTFKAIALQTAQLVKKYRGSLSGEHGDGRLRGEFIPLMVGEQNFQHLLALKSCWDPNGLFNPGKIVHTPPIDQHLRQDALRKHTIKTFFDFTKDRGFLGSVEKCTGSAVCRKPVQMGGHMCPSYQATLDEDKTTRARANLLRLMISNSKATNPFDQPELISILDLCLSCKACKTECPSEVDMAKLKAEVLQQYYQSHIPKLKNILVANIHQVQRLGSWLPDIYNYLVSAPLTSAILKKIMGMAAKRNLPKISKTTFRKWIRTQKNLPDPSFSNKVYLFIDEFTNYQDVQIGIKAVQLLNAMGYRVLVPKHAVSGRAMISKGFLKKVKKLAVKNIRLLSPVINDQTPLIGIEPSAILTFRDEYPDLVPASLKEQALRLSENVYLFEEFFMREVNKGEVSKEIFTDCEKKIKFHGHCHQKALAKTKDTLSMLSFPENYTAVEIPSGCCGMAGSFGFDQHHYALSMQIGEMVLFPEVRKNDDYIIAANGTSCRHQIEEGTAVKSFHPIVIMYDALKNTSDEKKGGT